LRGLFGGPWTIAYRDISEVERLLGSPSSGPFFGRHVDTLRIRSDDPAVDRVELYGRSHDIDTMLDRLGERDVPIASLAAVEWPGFEARRTDPSGKDHVES
jgi:hypothetical protein